MYNWIKFQYIYFYFSFIFACAVLFVYRNMEKKASRKLDKKKVSKDDEQVNKADNEYSSL